MKTFLLTLICITAGLNAKLVEFIFTDPGIEVGAFKNPLQKDDPDAPAHLQLQYLLKQRGWKIKAIPAKEFGKGDVIIFNNFPNWIPLNKLMKCKAKKILIIYEPPTVLPHLYDPYLHEVFDRVLTWHDKLVESQGHIKFNYTVNIGVHPDLPKFHERKFLCTMIGNKKSAHPDELYTTRRNAIDFYEQHPQYEFHLYGYGWEKEKLKCYRGAPEGKTAAIKQYKFSLCYENFRNDAGYITEKIFDCFYAGTVPIYLGAENVTDYIPENCFNI